MQILFSFNKFRTNGSRNNEHEKKEQQLISTLNW